MHILIVYSLISFSLSSLEDFFPTAFRERGREREKERERETLIGCLLVCALTGDWTLNLGMCPDWESNLWPFGLQDKAPTNWATLARVNLIRFDICLHLWNHHHNQANECIHNSKRSPCGPLLFLPPLPYDYYTLHLNGTNTIWYCAPEHLFELWILDWNW